MFSRLSYPGRMRLCLVLNLMTVLLCLPLVGVCATAEPESVPPQSVTKTEQDPDLAASTQVLDMAMLVGLDDLMKRIADKDVIFIGELHNSYADHLNQLAIIERLHARGKPLAIGMEFFQQPFQSVLDAFVAGDLSEAEMLKQTEYFERWRFDYRLYRPILRFAREQGIPLIALNLPKELTEKVGSQGLEALSAQERARLPAGMDSSNTAYRKRIATVYEQHPRHPNSDFERFLAVQLLWDEGMAERAAAYLAERPKTQLIVLAGAGHIEYGQGIPQRLARRRPVETVTILNGAHHAFAPGRADYLLFSPPVELPQRGLLGVVLDSESEGEGVLIESFADPSGAKNAGIKEGDRLVRIGDWPVTDYADVRIAMVDATPGMRLAVEVLRPGLIGKPERLRFEVALH